MTRSVMLAATVTMALLGVCAIPGYAQTVMPKGTLVSAGANSSGSYTFSVSNDGSVAKKYSLDVSCSGAAVQCALSGSALLRVNAHATAGVTVTYTTGTTGDGQVLLTATDEFESTSDQGSITISLPSANPQWSQDHTTWYTAEKFDTNYP